MSVLGVYTGGPGKSGLGWGSHLGGATEVGARLRWAGLGWGRCGGKDSSLLTWSGAEDGFLSVDLPGVETGSV